MGARQPADFFLEWNERHYRLERWNVTERAVILIDRNTGEATLGGLDATNAIARGRAVRMSCQQAGARL
jgi:hypothetical protein